MTESYAAGVFKKMLNASEMRDGSSCVNGKGTHRVKVNLLSWSNLKAGAGLIKSTFSLSTEVTPLLLWIGIK